MSFKAYADKKVDDGSGFFQFPIPGRCAGARSGRCCPLNWTITCISRVGRDTKSVSTMMGLESKYKEAEVADLGYNDSLSECKFKSKVVAVAKWACPTIATFQHSQKLMI